MNRWKLAASVVAVAGLLAACSGGGDAPAPTAGGGTAPTTAATGSSAPGFDTAAWCTVGTAEASEIQITFGEAAAAQDEWAADLGRSWRHYIPVKFTNMTDKPCWYSVNVELSVDGGPKAATERVSAPLKPGQSFVAQAFDLDEHVKFSADTQDATTTQKYEATVAQIKRAPAFEYYDMTFEVGERTYSGAATLISADLDIKAITEGMPERLWSAYIDYVYLLGLDANGDIITKAGNSVDEPKVPGKTTVQFAIGGGESNGYNRNLMPLSSYDSVVDWQIQIQPPYTELDR